MKGSFLEEVGRELSPPPPMCVQSLHQGSAGTVPGHPRGTGRLSWSDADNSEHAVRAQGGAEGHGE